MFFDTHCHLDRCSPGALAAALDAGVVHFVVPAAAVPKDRLLIETDAPYMAPEPHRGRSNQPAWLELVAQGVARARGETVDEIGRITTANARQIFGL
jgi:Tat protein secretion system quality control protein TatD with DNase activity